MSAKTKLEMKMDGRVYLENGVCYLRDSLGDGRGMLISKNKKYFEEVIQCILADVEGNDVLLSVQDKCTDEDSVWYAKDKGVGFWEVGISTDSLCKGLKEVIPLSIVVNKMYELKSKLMKGRVFLVYTSAKGYEVIQTSFNEVALESWWHDVCARDLLKEIHFGRRSVDIAVIRLVDFTGKEPTYKDINILDIENITVINEIL